MGKDLSQRMVLIGATVAGIGLILLALAFMTGCMPSHPPTTKSVPANRLRPEPRPYSY